MLHRILPESVLEGERSNKDQESLYTIFKQCYLFSKTEHPSRKPEIQNSLLNALEYVERRLKEFVRDRLKVTHKSELNWIFILH